MSDNQTGLAAFTRKYRKPIAITMEAAFAVAVTAYGIYGILKDDLVVPVGHTRSGGFHRSAHEYDNLHFHGAAALLLFAAYLCVAAGFLILIIRQLETKPGGKTDAGLANTCVAIGFAAIVVMLVLRWVGLV